jgi:hypothetical protein
MEVFLEVADIFGRWILEVDPGDAVMLDDIHSFWFFWWCARLIQLVFEGNISPKTNAYFFKRVSIISYFQYRGRMGILREWGK